MVHVPNAISDAWAPDTVQTAGVRDTKLTVSPELAVADRLVMDAAVCDPICTKLIVWLP